MARVVLLILVALCASFCLATSEDEYKTAFTNFMTTYSKSYKSFEFVARYNIFKANYDYINNWNAGNNGFELGVNKFADLTNAEFNALYKGLNGAALLSRPRNEAPLPERAEATCPKGNIAPNSSCDWRAAGVVTPVKNQGQCGSCWAFSTTGSTEGAHAHATGKLVSLSEQNLVDCSDAEGNEGCNGGLMDQAFQYIIKNKGVDTEASYPYHATDGKCHFSAESVGATITSFKDIPKDNEAALQTAIETVGPISVAIDASHNSFQFYRNGVYYEPQCSATQLDHGVLAVGLGQTDDKEYYIVKNSWGADWGSAGYILMSRNKHNNCGIATSASYPIA